MAQRDRTTCTLTVTWAGKSYEVEEVKDFEYSSDVLSVGEECTVTVVNDRRRYTDKLHVGATAELNMAHPRVNGGAPTLRHKGVITKRSPSFNPQGSLIKITIADLGWHLSSNCAPLWFNMRAAKNRDLVDPTKYQANRRGARKYFIDPSWGLKGVRFSNDENRARKLGKVLDSRARLGVAAAAAAAQDDLAVFNLQIEPGDKVFDKIAEVFRRENLLVNVSIDGYIQLFNPSSNQPPLYKIRCVDGDDANNVLDSQGMEDAKTIWTDVECVGEQIGFEGDNVSTKDNPNATKKRGAFYNRKALPFLHRDTFGDGEMYQSGLAARMAEWRYKRGIFDSWYHQYTVLDHHQGGTWWEADTWADVEDDEIGIYGTLYVASVHCRSTPQGDVTTVTVRKTGLLSASFGVHPRPPLIKGTAAARSEGTATGSAVKKEVK